MEKIIFAGIALTFVAFSFESKAQFENQLAPSQVDSLIYEDKDPQAEKFHEGAPEVKPARRR